MKFEILPPPQLTPKNVKLGVLAGGPWKIIVDLTLERYVVSRPNVSQRLSTLRDSKFQRSKVKVTTSHNVFR